MGFFELDLGCNNLENDDLFYDCLDDIFYEAIDDEEDIVRGRLTIYHKQTEPLVKYYRDDAKVDASSSKFIAISGVGSLDEVKDRITLALIS